MKKYLVEFIGTFFLVLAIGMAVIEPGAGNLAPIAIGAALMVMVYAGGHTSGAHYNPAITFAVWLRGRCATADVLPYVVSQILGSLAASYVVLYLKDNPVVIPQEIKIVPALVAELIGTFALAFVILNVATAKATAGNSHYGLSIGLTVTAFAFAFGGISGAVFNPAVAIGVTVMHLEKVANIWIYFVANFSAAAIAALTFKFINPDDK
ncbi:MAG TPA: aquaporin [Methylomirabilota bacterium]|nr:aquaporin [Methylomirabilota bacterium]